jgi:hypothetical protein
MDAKRPRWSMLRVGWSWALVLPAVLGACGGDGRPTAPRNEAPTACFVSAPSAGTTETEFSFDASCSSDAEDGTGSLMVRWDWENDSAWDTDWTAVKAASHRYDSEGRKVVRLAVRDRGGLLASALDTLEVGHANVAPEACVSLAPRDGTVATLFEADASCSSDLEDASDSLQVRWDWENDGVWDTDWTKTKGASHRYETPGRKTLRVEVRDTGGLSAAALDSAEVGFDYFGQTPPELIPEVFAPGIISVPTTVDYACTFSPNGHEVYFTRSTASTQTIYVTRLVDGTWTTPSPVSFSAGYPAHEPHLTLDDATIYFGWFRAVPPGEVSYVGDYGIWAADRTQAGWSAARYVGQGMFVSSSADGRLFVTDISSEPFYIAQVHLTAGRFTSYARIAAGTHPCIAPDGSYLVYDIEAGKHLVVRFRQPSGTWGALVDLTSHGIPLQAGIASLSPDGKYLFYSYNGDSYWVSTGLIEALGGGGEPLRR